MNKPRIMVVGARAGSLGEAVSNAALQAGYEVMAAGISGEALNLDLFNHPHNRLLDALMGIQPQHVVCTAGINMPQPALTAERDLSDWYRWHFEANVIGPMRLLDAWTQALGEESYLPDVPLTSLCHYVAISSNSARIPRSKSGAYCASKAALSMALRVAGRDALGGNGGYIAYGYEPGLLAGTQMTTRVGETLDMEPESLHRMKGSAVSRGIPVAWLAETIVNNLGLPGVALNGTLIPYDSGEV